MSLYHLVDVAPLGSRTVRIIFQRFLQLTGRFRQCSLSSLAHIESHAPTHAYCTRIVGGWLQ